MAIPRDIKNSLLEVNNSKLQTSDAVNYNLNQQSESDKARKRAEISQKRAAAGRKGGKAPHKCRGLGCVDEQTRKKVSSKGGSAPHKTRGRQAKNKIFN